MVWQELIETLIDDFISITVVIAAVGMVLLQIPVPEWFIAAFGLILAFYFKK